MTSKTLCAATAVLALAAGQASAQTSPAPAIVHGSPIPGICTFYIENAIAGSAVGKAASARLDVLRTQINAASAPDRAALQADVKAFQARQASLSADQRNAQAAPLQNRLNTLEQRANLGARELQATAQKARQRIVDYITPVVGRVYQSRRCSLLLNGEALTTANPAMDITPDVVRGLDATITTITFDLETPPAS